MTRPIKISLFILSVLYMHPAFSENTAKLSGRITSPGKEGAKFATVYLKETTYGCTTDSNGKFEISAPAGSYVMVVSILGYDTA